MAVNVHLAVRLMLALTILLDIFTVMRERINKISGTDFLIMLLACEIEGNESRRATR